MIKRKLSVLLLMACFSLVLVGQAQAKPLSPVYGTTLEECAQLPVVVCINDDYDVIDGAFSKVSEDNRFEIYVPLRQMSNALGYNIEWNQERKFVTIDLNDGWKVNLSEEAQAGVKLKDGQLLNGSDIFQANCLTKDGNMYVTWDLFYNLDMIKDFPKVVCIFNILNEPMEMRLVYYSK
jgi:hypothetical protein